MQIVKTDPILIGKCASTNPINNFHFKLDCYDDSGNKIGWIELNDTLFSPEYYSPTRFEVQGCSQKMALNAVFTQITPYGKDLGDRIDIPLPQKILIGHRGWGKNAYQSDYLENTMPSFEAAISNGADFVEFDIQLSNENVPVIFHDFVMTLPEEQPDMPEPIARNPDGSVNYSINQFTTQQFIDSGYFTQWKVQRDKFSTLMTDLPSKAMFDVEIKYPYDPKYIFQIPYVERNKFLNIVLKDMEQYGGDRKMFFSSFDPLVVASLRLKQNKWPVYQLVEAIKGEDFSSKVKGLAALGQVLGYDGFVSDATDLLNNEALIPDLLNMGYVISTYGNYNVDEKQVRKQFLLKIRGICTDNTTLVKKIINENKKI